MRSIDTEENFVVTFGSCYPYPYKCAWCGGWNRTDKIDKHNYARFWTCQKCGINTFTSYNPNKRRWRQIEKAQIQEENNAATN